MQDLTGGLFGRLTVTSFSHKDKFGLPVWNVLCSCGKEKQVSSTNLRGSTKSCGCLRRESSANRLTTHGLSLTKTYKIWKGMISRCYYPMATGYANYGGRGIKVCDSWRDSYQNFLSDMGECEDGFSINRIDFDGPYSPDNCTWSDIKTQNTNKRNNREVTHLGETLCISDWAVRLGVQEASIRRRLDMGWSDEKSIATPFVVGQKTMGVTLTIDGETKTLVEWAVIAGLDPSSVRQRLKNGLDEKSAVFLPKSRRFV